VDWVFVNCWAVRNHQFTRGDIVVLISPKDPYDYIIKRLVGLEGDVFVNSNFNPAAAVTVGKGSCWVEGDNLKNSVDSNSNYGPVSQVRISFAKKVFNISRSMFDALGRMCTSLLRIFLWANCSAYHLVRRTP
jgi:signal peptidase I